MQYLGEYVCVKPGRTLNLVVSNAVCCLAVCVCSPLLSVESLTSVACVCEYWPSCSQMLQGLITAMLNTC